MRCFCTLSDKNYVFHGLALLESLRRHAGDFRLYYLCLDEETERLVHKSGGNDVIIVGVRELEKTDPQLTALRQREYKHFCWALAPFWTSHLFENVDTDGIHYLDSDLFFRQPLKPIFDALGNRSIGLFSHRSIPDGHPAGIYNVGMVCFQGELGKRCASWWREVVLKPNQWSAKYGTCGDQRYLELFAPLFGVENIAFLDETIGYGAPWNFHLYRYAGDHIVWNGERQLLIFNHFSHFKPDFEHNTYRVVGYGDGWDNCDVDPQVRAWYDEYFAEMKRVRAT